MDLNESVVGEFAGPTTGADRAVLLAPSAGADRDAPVLVAVAQALAEIGIPSLRFDYPYRLAGRRAPDRPMVLTAVTRSAAAKLSERVGLPPDRLVVGGRSMGGRYASMLVADAHDPLPALGLLLLSYPLHPAGLPEKIRDAHFGSIKVPVLCLSGTRDALAPRPALELAVKKITGPTTIHWLETADHSYRPLKRSGITVEDVITEVAHTAAQWVADC